MLNRVVYPLAAVAGQDSAKKALLTALVNPKAGGLLLGGAKGTAKSVMARGAAELIAPRKLVEIPLNITEDMLFGSIDIEYAVNFGERRLLPGILGRADGNVIYVDEINLLRQDLLTAVLDANAAGFNQIERDGISCRHDVACTIIGTMNPEEGTLPAHILDRFGMYVDVQCEKDTEVRKEIITRAISYGRNPSAFAAAYERATESLRENLAAAVKLLPQVKVSEAMIHLAAQMCTQAFCAGHRAEIYLLEASRALAALDGRDYVLPGDMEAAAVYVLPHRMRKPPERQEMPNDDDARQDEENNSDENDNEDDADESLSDEITLPPELNDDGSSDGNNENDEQNSESDAERDRQNENNLAPEERHTEIDKSFRLPKLLLDLGKSSVARRGSGKRSRTRTDLKQGRYVRAEMSKHKVEDLAFDATIRAAAPYQRLREDNGCALHIKKEDLRQKVREKRIGSTFLFAVDASGSMGARERMGAVKGAVFYMLQDAYQKRDRVGMIGFRRDKAEVLLPITRSVDLAQKCLADMPTGGKTPLTDGLATALLTLSKLGKTDKHMEPVLVLVTDGRANMADGDSGDPVESAVRMAEKIGKAKITSVVIDTESDFIKLGLAKKIAAAMGASYYRLDRLSQESILRIIRNLGER